MTKTKVFEGKKYPDRVRGFIVTDWNNNETKDYETWFEKNKKQVKFMAFSKEFEKAPTTGKLHKHVFLYYHNAKNWSLKLLNKIGSTFGDVHNYVAPVGGKIVECEAYISKESDLIQLGIKPIQGLSMNLRESVEEITKGNLTIDEIVIQDPMTYHIYGRTLEKAFNIALSKKFRTWMTEGYWIFGTTGVGKSHISFYDYNPDTHYILEVDDNGFWENYKGQKTIIINEFRGEIKFSKLLELCDKWALNVKQKGSYTVPFLGEKIIITSSKTPEECYRGVDDRWDQFNRRFKVFKKEKSIIEIENDVWTNPTKYGLSWYNKIEYVTANNNIYNNNILLDKPKDIIEDDMINIETYDICSESSSQNPDECIGCESGTDTYNHTCDYKISHVPESVPFYI